MLSGTILHNIDQACQTGSSPVSIPARAWRTAAAALVLNEIVVSPVVLYVKYPVTQGLIPDNQVGTSCSIDKYADVVAFEFISFEYVKVGKDPYASGLVV